MGCQSEVYLGRNLTFSADTHDPDNNGNAIDADADPTYRIYEDVTAPAILTGTMDKLDDPNTIGCYAKQIACTVANGFEIGKTYTIYIEASVHGDIGTIPYTFTVKADYIIDPSALPCTITITNTDTLLPEPGVQVRITTDIGGVNGIWIGYTDAFGVARDWLGQLPVLLPGTYWYWKLKVGYTDIDPVQMVVS